MRTMERAKHEGRRRRRNYTPEFKHEVIQCCEQLGVSIAAVARAYDLHPNLLRRWVAAHEHEGQQTSPEPVSRCALQVAAPDGGGTFMPITMPRRVTAESSHSGSINIELTGGGIIARVSWPVKASANCASWLRELMK